MRDVGLCCSRGGVRTPIGALRMARTSARAASRWRRDRSASTRRQEGDDAFGRLRLTEAIALPLIASEEVEKLDLLGGFETLGVRADPEVSGKRYDGLHDRNCFLVVRDPHDERPVDLDLIDGKLPQIAQGRIAGTEIVEREPNSA